MKDLHHWLVFNPREGALGHCGCGGHPKWLPRKTTFAEEIARIQYGYRSFLAVLRYDREFNRSFFDIKNSVRRTTLNKDRFLLWERYNCPSCTDFREELVSIEFSGLGIHCGHGAVQWGSIMYRPKLLYLAIEARLYGIVH